MDKSCQSSSDSHSTITTTTTNANNSTSNSRDPYLKNLNKLSHKISKPIVTNTTKKPPFDHNFNQHQQQPQSSQSTQQQQQQPPVYNINKSDFRDVVQKLTGSPAHERFSTPPPIQPPKPPSSRLQRIRPPPLGHVSNRPPPLLNSAFPPPPQQQQQHHLQPSLPTAVNSIPAANTSTSAFIQRPSAPLPPFSTVHPAAESPVSAYMRYLQNSTPTTDSNKSLTGFSPLAPLVSPRWNNLAAQLPQQQFQPTQQGSIPSPTTGMIASQPQFQLPTSPLPFGLNSPRSPYALLSPSLLLSPSSFPASPYVRHPQNSTPTVDSNKPMSGLSPMAPLVSPRWNNVAPRQLQQQFAPIQQSSIPSTSSGMIASQPQFQFPMSPLPFGYLNSPRSPYALLSPSLLLSPSSFPLSPTLPVPSPRWRGY